MADLMQGGQGTELYRAQNDNHVPIVQQPYFATNGVFDTCVDARGNAVNMSGNLIGESFDGRHAYPMQLMIETPFGMGDGSACNPVENGFSSQLFTGSTSPQFLPTNIAHTANKQAYYYDYFSTDCSMLPLQGGGAYSYSKYPDYLIVSENMQASGTDSRYPAYMWIYDGQYGSSNDPLNVPSMIHTVDNYTDGNGLIWNKCT